MSREHPEVRLNRTTFSEQWEVVRLAADGRTITDRWPLHPADATALDAAFGGRSEGDRGRISALVEASSLGTAAAVAARESVTDEQVARVIARAKELGADRG